MHKPYAADERVYEVAQIGRWVVFMEEFECGDLLVEVQGKDGRTMLYTELTSCERPKD